MREDGTNRKKDFMWYGNVKGMDVSTFPNAQMMYPAAGKERRKAFGLNGNMWKKSVFMILLFVVLFWGRTALVCALAEQMGIFTLVLTTSSTRVMMGLILLNFFFAVPALLVNVLFFGIFIFAKPFREREGEETASGE